MLHMYLLVYITLSHQYDYLLTAPYLTLTFKAASTLLYQHIEYRLLSDSTALQVGRVARKYSSTTLLLIFAIPKKIHYLLSIKKDYYFLLPTSILS